MIGIEDLWKAQEKSLEKYRLPGQETWSQSLGQEEALEEEMASSSSILAWKIPRTGKPGGLQPMGLQKSN